MAIDSKPSTGKYIFLLFWIIVLLDIIGISLNFPIVHAFCKPLLMPALILSVCLLSTKSLGRKKIIAALSFSFLGDVFLMFEEKFPLCFIFGLACFLITHIFYISYFVQKKDSTGNLMKAYPFLPIIIILYTFFLLYLLFPHLGDLKIPVIVYACIISAMLYFSLQLSGKMERTNRYLFIGGALCFVISDSLLALNKFYQPFLPAPVLIMATYCAAQFLIVKGFIGNRD
jgi:uncharacterized membrane protein YhhN